MKKLVSLFLVVLAIGLFVACGTSAYSRWSTRAENAITESETVFENATILGDVSYAAFILRTFIEESNNVDRTSFSANQISSFDETIAKMQSRHDELIELYFENMTPEARQDWDEFQQRLADFGQSLLEWSVD